MVTSGAMPRRPRKRQYGLGSIQRRGDRWRVQYRVADQRRSKSFTDRALAEAFARRHAGTTDRAAAGLPPDPRTVPTLAELVPPWLKARASTHRAAAKDRGRWKNHLAPTLGRLRPDQVDAATLRRLAVDRLAAGCSSSSVRLLMRLLSTLYADLIDDGHATVNPVRELPRKTRRLFRPAHDPKTTPFVEDQRDIGRIFLALPEPANIAYALGALAGLRTGECLGLRWPHVDLPRRRLHVQESHGGLDLKDGESRVVPILDALAPILEGWRARAGDRTGRVVPPLRVRAKAMGPHALGKVFSETLAELQPPLPRPLTFYQATRHTFASHWVMAGGSLEHLREILGHSSVTTTERYAHLRPEMFGASAHARMAPIGTELAPAPAMKGLRGKVKSAADTSG